MAVGLPLLIGFAALGVDVGIVYHRQVVLQSISDTSALSGAVALPKGREVALLETHAVSAENGYPHGVRGATITPNIPPTRGAYAADPNAVEVIVVAPQRPFLSRLFHPEDYIVTTRSVASYTLQPGCILALNPSAAPAVSVTGSAELKASNCDIYASSSASGAVSTHGAGSIAVRGISTPGSVSGKKIAAQTIATGSGVEPVDNPYAALAIPPAGPCMPPPPGSKTYTLSPGRYCGGLAISGNADVTFLPGVYVIDGGELRIGGGRVKGEGVTFVLTSYSAAPPATVTIGGGSDAYFTAPASGPYAGVVFFADPRSPATATHNFTGGGDQYIGGAVVAPSSRIRYGGSRGSIKGPGCTQLVGWTVEFNGNSELNADCTALGAASFGAKTVRLVE